MIRHHYDSPDPDDPTPIWEQPIDTVPQMLEAMHEYLDQHPETEDCDPEVLTRFLHLAETFMVEREAQASQLRGQVALLRAELHTMQFAQKLNLFGGKS